MTGISGLHVNIPPVAAVENKEGAYLTGPIGATFTRRLSLRDLSCHQSAVAAVSQREERLRVNHTKRNEKNQEKRSIFIPTQTLQRNSIHDMFAMSFKDSSAFLWRLIISSMMNLTSQSKGIGRLAPSIAGFYLVTRR
ncbi:uncharacterized protein LOC144066816 isoform X1 [Stigmatopora argus]